MNRRETTTFRLDTLPPMPMPPEPIDVSAELTRSSLPWAYNVLNAFVGSHTPNEREAFLALAGRLPRVRFVAWPYPRTEVVR